MQKNDVYEIEITGMTEEGDGVGRVENMAVFVPYTIVGETVRVLIVKILKNYAFGKLQEVLKPSENRVKAECPYFYQCGGCQLWHMNRDAELAYKRQKVEDCLSRLGKLQVKPEKTYDCAIMQRYRNKAQYPVTTDGIGFYRRNSHQVIPMTDCLLQGEHDAVVMKLVREWMQKEKIAPYCEETHVGTLRHIYIREGKKELLLVLVTRTEKPLKVESLLAQMREQGIPVVGIVQNVNDKRTNVVLGRKNLCLWGKDFLIDSIGEVKFKISPQSFYQVNRFETKELYRMAEKFAGLTGKETLWDIYCGIGTIGQFMAQKAGKVIGVEIVPEAVENAKENAVLNGISNSEYYCGKAEVLVPKLVAKGEKADVVILDPPRKGCETELLDAVVSVKPKRIVYISCKPSTLARDLKYLEEKGYHTQTVVPVNMFPRTSHVETVTLLTKLKESDSVTVELDLDELEVTAPETKATYSQIKEYVLNKFGFKVSSLNIAQVKQECGIIERENYNKPSDDYKQPNCPKHKVDAIIDAFGHFRMI